METDKKSGLDSIRQLAESIGATATVQQVFGEPIRHEDKTVIPVARVAYGFGGGFGQGRRALQNADGEGGGAGGGMRAEPAGVLEITAGATRFIPFPKRPWGLAAAALGCIATGLLLHRRR